MRGIRPVFNPIILKIETMYSEAKTSIGQLEVELNMPYYNRNIIAISKNISILKRVEKETTNLLNSDTVKVAIAGERRTDIEQKLVTVRDCIKRFEEKSIA